MFGDDDAGVIPTCAPLSFSFSLPPSSSSSSSPIISNTYYCLFNMLKSEDCKTGNLYVKHIRKSVIGLVGLYWRDHKPFDFVLLIKRIFIISPLLSVLVLSPRNITLFGGFCSFISKGGTLPCISPLSKERILKVERDDIRLLLQLLLPGKEAAATCGAA